MLVANIDVENRFANGTQGRIVQWSPDLGIASAPKLGKRKKLGPEDDTPRVTAGDAEVMVRFVHEHALREDRREWVSGVDFIDITPRSEEVPKAKGKPQMTQLQVIPANALTIHKVQALTIKNNVYGCLEGVFAAGQVYVLWSRVTNPLHFHLVGLPPLDMLDEVAQAWRDAGMDVDKCFKRAVDVTGDWMYTDAAQGEDATKNVRSRLTAKYDHQRRVPLRLKTLKDILGPQPTTAKVLHQLLEWIDQEDLSSQRQPKSSSAGSANPSVAAAIFKNAPENWWMTEFERRKPPDVPTESEDEDEEPSEDDDSGTDGTDTESIDELGATSTDPKKDDAISSHPRQTFGAGIQRSTDHMNCSSKRLQSDATHASDATDSKKKKMDAVQIGWLLTLQQMRIGVPIAKPEWYMQRESNAVLPTGTQAAATCGLHAFNHVMHACHGFRCWSWGEFDARVSAQDIDINGNWEFAALQANLGATAALIEPVSNEDLPNVVAWIDDWHRLRIWQPATLGLMVHVPGHWIAIVRPEGAASTSNVALLCDSLYPLPYQINRAEILTMMASIQQHQSQAHIVDAGEWSVYKVFQ